MPQWSTLEHVFAGIEAGGTSAGRASAEDAGIRISYFDQRSVSAAADPVFTWICYCVTDGGCDSATAHQ